MLEALLEDVTDDSKPSQVAQICQESAIWTALGMDELTEEMSKHWSSNNNPIFMGTGYTHNACYQCNNSATSAYCNPPMCPK